MARKSRVHKHLVRDARNTLACRSVSTAARRNVVRSLCKAERVADKVAVREGVEDDRLALQEELDAYYDAIVREAFSES